MTKLCIDCVHYRNNDVGSPSNAGIPAGMFQAYVHECRAFTSVVDGKTDPKACEHMRSVPSCGHDAVSFKPRMQIVQGGA